MAQYLRLVELRTTMVLWCLCANLLLSCSNEVGPIYGTIDFESQPRPPVGYAAIPYPSDNTYSKERAEFGKKLFFDTELSADRTVSCATCHRPEFAFADNKPFSTGVYNRVGKRNVPSLMNVAYVPRLTREGMVPTLEMQVLVPIQEHDEMDMNILDIVERLKRNPEYTELSTKTFGRELDSYVLVRAIAAYERMLLSSGSQYDGFVEWGMGLTDKERKGLDLFMSNRTNCSTCHTPPEFTTHDFANNGVHKTPLFAGRFSFTNNPSDSGAYKIPSLRNVAVTYPYMIDGSITTLAAVVDHYNRGGSGGKHQSPLIRPLGLTIEEQSQLVAFLRTVTDSAYER